MYVLIFISLQSYSCFVDQVEIQVELEDIEEEATHEEVHA